MASADVNSPEGKKAIAFFAEHHTVIDPTMALMEMQLRPADKSPTEMEPGIAKVAPELREQLVSGGVPAEMAPLAQKMRKHDLELIEALHKAGVPIVAGTDQSVPGDLGLSRDRAIHGGGIYAHGGFAVGDHRTGARHEGGER